MPQMSGGATSRAIPGPVQDALEREGWRRGRGVLVAMSGGVDSAVAAGLLAAGGGLDVVGATLKVFCYGDRGPSARGCCSLDDIQAARRTAVRLGLRHIVLDLEESFRRTVIDDFIDEYGRGRTPNPCVRCNTFVKFGTLIGWAEKLGLEGVATGHYVRKVAVTGDDGEPGWVLARGRDVRKDQSYVLWGLHPSLLDRFLFPVGELEKRDVRRLAGEMAPLVADKPESQDICFVGDRHYTDFLREEGGGRLPLSEEGPIRMGGALLGRHRGLIRYTVGQRRGLGVTSPTKNPLYVLRLDTETNTLWVGERSDLESRGLVADQRRLHGPARSLTEGGLTVQIRAHQEAVGVASLDLLEGGRFRVEFSEPVNAVSPGQSAVLYRGDRLVAGGRIVKSLPRADRARSHNAEHALLKGPGEGGEGRLY